MSESHLSLNDSFKRRHQPRSTRGQPGVNLRRPTSSMLVSFCSAFIAPAPLLSALNVSAVALDQGLTLVTYSAQLERFNGIGGARPGCVARVQEGLGGVYGV
jgi:hypothetical protein